MNTNELD